MRHGNRICRQVQLAKTYAEQASQESVEENLQGGQDESAVEYDFQIVSDWQEGAAYPTFTLITYPERAEGMYFAYSLDGGGLISLAGNTHTPDEHGSYRYYLLREDGTQAGQSGVCDILPPEEEEIPEENPQPEEPAPETPGEDIQPDLPEDPENSETPENPEAPVYTLLVDVYDYLPDAGCEPTFTLSCEQWQDGMAYGVSFEGGAPIVLSGGNSYAPTQSGVYVFVLMDAQGAVLAQSDPIPVIYEDLPDAEVDAAYEYDVYVEADGYTADAACAPAFVLTASKELTENMSYIVVKDDSEYDVLPGASFAPTASGAYRFAIMDADGGIRGVSDVWTVLYAPPEEEETEEEEEIILEYEIQVEAESFYPGIPCKPVFHLRVNPGLYSGMYFAVSIDGGNLIPFSGTEYVPSQSGSYRFVLLDAEEMELAQSASFEVLFGEVTEEDVEEPVVLGPGPAVQENVPVDEMNDEEVSFDLAVTETVSNEDGSTATTYESLADSVTVYTTPEAAAESDIPVLHVQPPQGYVQGGTYEQALTFVLSGIPEGSADYAYLVDDGSGYTQLIGESYTVSDLGSHKLRFAILDLRTNAIIE